jgi:hypothetical protein
MRASSRRSFARLVAPALLAVAACTPQLAVDNRPFPCAPGLAVCPASGLCVDPSEIGKTPQPGVVPVCAPGYTARQGTTVFVQVPAARASDVTIKQVSTDLVASVPTVDVDAMTFVVVQVQHGSSSGDHYVTFETRSDAQSVIRKVLVTVSPIVVLPATGNDDLAAGTFEDPFKTLGHAASVAGTGPTGIGDTIEVSNGPKNTVAEPSTALPVQLPAGVTLSGQDMGGTFVKMPLVLMGDATFEDISLGQRLTIDVAGSTVTLDNTGNDNGVELTPNAVGAKVSIHGVQSLITNNSGAIPLLDAGDQTKVSITEGAKITRGTGDETLEVIKMAGDSQTLTIVESTVNNSVGTVAITDTGAHNQDLIGQGVEILGRVNITGAFNVAQIMGASLKHGQRLEGGILFQGASLDVESSQVFSGGIEQNNPAGNVRVRSSTFEDYVVQGYHLIAGHADLGTSSDFGMNLFTSAFTPTGATALLIDSPDSPTSVLSMSNTTFDSALPSPCTVHGPAVLKNVFDIINHVGIDLY